MLKFGKYKGRSFEYIYKVDKGYCAWFLENCSRGKAFKDFIKTKNLFDPESIKGRKTTATDLAKKISLDPFIKELVGGIIEFDEEEPPEELHEEELHEEELHEEELHEEELHDKPKRVKLPPVACPRGSSTTRRNITPQLYGQFVDYYIRYRISKKLGREFNDKRVDKVIASSNEDAEIIKKAYEEVKNGVTENLHQNILKCAIANSMAFGGKYDLKFLNRKLRLDDDVVERVEHFIISLDEDSNIELNPNLSCGRISADADIIVDNMIIDIKTGKENMLYYISQLMIYSVLFKRKHSVRVGKIIVFNPTIDESMILINLTDEKVDLFEAYLVEYNLL